ncbi:MAG: type II secretion system F family protein [Clostridiaceae bacterium]|nr:type II secretion system F family protein [Clostridiaceae bacterium]
MGKKAKGYEMDLSILCHQFSLVLKSGIHPVEGIPLVLEDTVNPRLRKALESIRDEVVFGSPMHSAFEASKAFPAYMTALVKVGEKTGMLEPVFEGLSRFYENMANTRRRIRSAVSYPLILAVFMLGVIALISLKVIPLFVEILTSLGGTVPAQASVFIALGNGLKDGFVIAATVLAILIVVGWLVKRLGIFRSFIDRFKVVNPFTGAIYRKIITSRFSGAMSLTLKSGMTLTEGFSLVSGVLDNSYVSRKIKEAVSAVSKGKSFWEALKDTGLFPGLFVRLVRTGEKTGSLDAMMDKVSHTWQEEADASLDRVINSIEPVCVTVLSLVLAGVLLSVILPLISIMSSIG